MSVTRGGRIKQILDYLGAPDSLKQLEKQIDEAAGTKRWVTLDISTLRQMIRDGWSPSAADHSELLRKALQEDNVAVIKAPPRARRRSECHLLRDRHNGVDVKLLVERGADPGRHPAGPSALECARDSQRSERLYPSRLIDSDSPYLKDFDAVITLLEEALTKRPRK